MKNEINRHARSISALLNFLLLSFSASALAQVDYIASVGTTLGTGLTLALNAISAIVFIIMVWAIVTKYTEVTSGRASWGEVFMPLVVGAIVLAFLAIIRPDADTAIGTLGSINIYIPFA